MRTHQKMDVKAFKDTNKLKDEALYMRRFDVQHYDGRLKSSCNLTLYRKLTPQPLFLNL